MMKGPVWGGPQAAGKRHSQPLCQERLPHPRGLSRPTKPVARVRGSVDRRVPSRSAGLGGAGFLLPTARHSVGSQPTGYHLASALGSANVGWVAPRPC